MPMRPNPTVEPEPQAETDDPRVVVINADGRSQRRPSDAEDARPEPWTPRVGFEVPRRESPQPTAPEPAPTTRAVLTRTHRRMLTAFASICVGMVIVMLTWRLWSLPTPPEQAELVVNPPSEELRAAPSAPAPAEPIHARPSGSGAVSTEIRVLQPNYAVAPGDTLASIARRHGTTIEALASINNLENRNSLRVGQRLIIP